MWGLESRAEFADDAARGILTGLVGEAGLTEHTSSVFLAEGISSAVWM